LHATGFEFSDSAADNWQILVRNSRHLGVAAAGHRDYAFVEALFRTAKYRDDTPA
jgi:hypothetical protein